MANPHLNFQQFLGPAKTYWNNLKGGELLTVGATAIAALMALTSMGITLPIIGRFQAMLPKIPAFGGIGHPTAAIF